jgi:hypothetical protein
MNRRSVAPLYAGVLYGTASRGGVTLHGVVHRLTVAPSSP